MPEDSGYNLKPEEPRTPPLPPPAVAVPAAGARPEVDPQDVRANRAMAILAYMGVLVLAPLLVARDSPFARHHANQGFMLFLGEAIFWAACKILALAFLPLLAVPGMKYVGAAFAFLGALVWVLFIAFSLLGIRHALAGGRGTLPLIGHNKIIDV